MNNRLNNKNINNLKDYLNKNYKLIGFEYQTNKPSFKSVNNDIIVIKILCKCCDKCDPCKCNKIIDFIVKFCNNYSLYCETNKVSVNGYFEYHLFKLFI